MVKKHHWLDITCLKDQRFKDQRSSSPSPMAIKIPTWKNTKMSKGHAFSTRMAAIVSTTIRIIAPILKDFLIVLSSFFYYGSLLAFANNLHYTPNSHNFQVFKKKNDPRPLNFIF